MKLWLFERKDKVDWDEYISFVVRAKSAKDARKLLLRNINSYHHGYIGDPARLVVSELTVDGPEQIVMDSFQAG